MEKAQKIKKTFSLWGLQAIYVELAVKCMRELVQ